MNLKDKRILLTGGSGFLGRFVFEKLLQIGVSRDHIVIPRSFSDDLREKQVCERLVKNKDVVVHLAAKADGSGLFCENPAEFFYDNLMMGLQLIEESRKVGVEKFVSVGSVTAYPDFLIAPFKEEDLWKGYPDEGRAFYGIPKRVLSLQALFYHQQYDLNTFCLLPSIIYGPSDLNFTRLIPSLILRIYRAMHEKKKYIEVWGTGNATRDLLYVVDAAEAVVSATEKYNKPYPVNIGSGREIKIRDLVDLIAELMGFWGEIRWDSTKSEGLSRVCLDVSRARKEFGFEVKTSLKEGLQKTIDWFRQNLQFSEG